MFSRAVVQVSILCVMVLGGGVSCGGGGGSGGSSTPGANISLDATNGSTMATNISRALPGCSYTPDGSLSEPAGTFPITLVSDTVNNILAQGRNPMNRASDINEVNAGDCPDAPGTFTVVGTHSNGVDTTTLTFEQYCTVSEEGSSTINGILNVVDVGVPSPTGPIPQYLTASSGSGGIQIEEVTSEGTFNHSTSLSNFRFDYADENTGATAEDPIRMSVGSFSITEGRTNTNFSLAGVNATQYDEGTNSVVQINSLAFTDPQVGTVNIATTPLVIDDTGEFVSGTISATGSDGSTMVLTRNETVRNGFSVMLDDGQIGMMDCTTTDLSL